MMAGRTYGGKLAVGVGITVLFTLLTIITSVVGLIFVVGAKDAAITAAVDDLTGSENLSRTIEMRIADYRAYLLEASAENARLTDENHQLFRRQLDSLNRSITDQGSKEVLARISGFDDEHAAASARVMAAR